jgi:chlorobactene glucosyltransferase
MTSGITIITLLNMLSSRRNSHVTIPRTGPKVSILVPARNEVDVIAKSVHSLIAQDYPNVDIWILDDQSTDGTGELARSFSRLNNRVKVISGLPVPPGWIGKHWACHQLSQAADGDLLLFTDADTWLSTSMVSKAVNIMLSSDSDLVSFVPGRETSSILQKLTLPFIDWFALGCFPLTLARKLRFPEISMAFGQFMLFRRASYEQIGGHESIKSKIVDDMELGRRIKQFKLCLHLLDGTNDIRCHMYRNNSSLIQGFARNIFPSLGSNTLRLTTTWSFMAGIGVAPAAMLIARGLGSSMGGLPMTPSVIALILMTLSWFLTLKRTPHSAWLSLVHPIITSMILALSILSYARVKKRTIDWKGRNLLK